MRHRKSGRRLGRTTSHRKATMKNLTVALFTHQAIETSVAKCKELRRFAEPLITLAKKDSVANRRRAFAALRDELGRLTDQNLLAFIKEMAPGVAAVDWNDGVASALSRLLVALLSIHGPEVTLLALPSLESYLPSSRRAQLRPVRLAAEVLTKQLPPELPAEPEEMRRTVREVLKKVDSSGQ